MLEKIRKPVFFIAAALCLTPWISPPVALLLGLVVAQFPGHPYIKQNKKITTLLLQVSVVGLGFGMNINSALAAGKDGFYYTAISIIVTLIIGLLLGKLFSTDHKTSYLVSSGTAICGGSAIAAISPVIDAEEKQVTVALGIVFILNAIALLVFPLIGEAVGMTQEQFGIWSAIAIHDTSSVVGAASRFGEKALEIATTVKLARALWIIPLALFTSWYFKRKDQKIKVPYFIGYFILAMILSTYVEPVRNISPYLVAVAKAGLTLTLFLIGAGMSMKMIRSVGVKPFLQGTILWLIVSAVVFWAVRMYN